MRNIVRLAAIAGVVVTMLVADRVGSMAAPVQDCLGDSYGYTTYWYFWSFDEDNHSATVGGKQHPDGAEGFEEYNEENWLPINDFQDEEVAHARGEPGRAWGRASPRRAGDRVRRA